MCARVSRRPMITPNAWARPLAMMPNVIQYIPATTPRLQQQQLRGSMAYDGVARNRGSASTQVAATRAIDKAVISCGYVSP